MFPRPTNTADMSNIPNTGNAGTDTDGVHNQQYSVVSNDDRTENEDLEDYDEVVPREASAYTSYTPKAVLTNYLLKVVNTRPDNYDQHLQRYNGMRIRRLISQTSQIRNPQRPMQRRVPRSGLFGSQAVSRPDRDPSEILLRWFLSYHGLPLNLPQMLSIFRRQLLVQCALEWAAQHTPQIGLVGMPMQHWHIGGQVIWFPMNPAFQPYPFLP